MRALSSAIFAVACIAMAFARVSLARRKPVNMRLLTQRLRALERAT